MITIKPKPYIMNALLFKESVSNGKIWRLNPEHICAFECSGHYIKVQHTEGVFLILMSMSELMEILNCHIYFKRIHRSFIISELHIRYVEQNRVCLKNGITIPIGRNYRSEFYKGFK